MLNIELTHTHTHRLLSPPFTAYRGVRLCREALHNHRCTFCTHIGERPQSPPAVLHLLISSSLWPLKKQNTPRASFLWRSVWTDESVWLWARLSPAAPGSGFLPLLLCRRSEKLLPFPQTHPTRLLGNHAGDGRARNAGKQLSKSESDLHISPYLTFRPSSRFVTGFVCLFVFFYNSCRGRTDYFIWLFWLPPVEEVFTKRLEDQLPSSCQSGQASARWGCERLSVRETGMIDLFLWWWCYYC